jgi:signal peptidase I
MSIRGRWKEEERVQSEQEHVVEPSTDRWTALGGVLLSALLVWSVIWLGLAVLVPTLVLGYQPHAIVSGSMEPAIRAGDVVLNVEVSHPVESGRVITFTDPTRPEALITHRVVAVTEDGLYRTRGDANENADSTLVPPDHVHGQGRLLVPMAGMPLLWATGQPLLLGGLLFAMAVACAVLVGPRSTASKAEAGRSDAEVVA